MATAKISPKRTTSLVSALERQAVIRLSPEATRKVLHLMDHPPEPNQTMKAAVKAYKDLVRT